MDKKIIINFITVELHTTQARIKNEMKISADLTG